MSNASRDQPHLEVEALRAAGRQSEALLLCLKILSSNTEDHATRLVLSRVFIDLGATPFAVRELEQLCRDLPEIKTLKRLLDTIAPGRAKKISPQETSQGPIKQTVAETDFSFDDLEAIEEPVVPKKS